jgi:hypothetical protein
MRSNFRLNNDDLLHWCLGPILGWALCGLALGFAIHSVFGVGTSKLILFFVIQCAVQIAVSPWLFRARATVENPQGLSFKRGIIVAVWFAAASEAAVLQLFAGDFSNKGAVVIFMATPIIFSLVFLFSLRRILSLFT